MKVLLLVVSFFSFGINVYALKNIKVDNEQLVPPFNKDITVYNYYTTNDKVKIIVYKELNEEVKGYGYFNIKDGLNELKVSTKDKIYTINVYKNYKNTTSNALLKGLTIDNYNINFKEDIFDYNITLNNESFLKINYELYNDSDQVSITGNGNFDKENNIVLIEVSNYEKKNIYKINVHKTISVFKESEYKKEFTYKEKETTKIIIVSVSCVLVFLLFYALFIKKLI